jgi:RNA polymerase sigma factor (sigma-70 family)
VGFHENSEGAGGLSGAPFNSSDYRDLYQFLLRHLPAQEVEDAVQEAYLRFLKVDPAVLIRNPKGYIHNIAWNVVCDHRTRRKTQKVSFEAARWLVALESDDEAVKAAFVAWVRESPRHFGAFLRASAQAHECAEAAKRVIHPQPSQFEPATNGNSLQSQLYLRYRRPLLQVFHHRRIGRDVADDLLQRTFLHAIEKTRKEGLDDPGNLGGYLYRTACKLATAYSRGELSHRHESNLEVLTSIKDEAMSLEERLDQEQLACHVRDLMDHLPAQRDREVLERFYLHEEPPSAISQSLQLTDIQFDQVLRNARERFRDILRKCGVTMAAV